MKQSTALVSKAFGAENINTDSDSDYKPQQLKIYI